MAERLMKYDVPGWSKEVASWIVDTSAILGRSPDLSFNLVGQLTDALLHTEGDPGMECLLQCP